MIPLPDIFKQLDQSDQVSLNAVWSAKDSSLAGKLKFIDVFVNTQPVEFRSAYRKWRLGVDRETVGISFRGLLILFVLQNEFY